MRTSPLASLLNRQRHGGSQHRRRLPHRLDGVHAEGAGACSGLFANSFVNFSLCSPSRASFLTGKAAHNTGIKANKPRKGGGWET